MNSLVESILVCVIFHFVNGITLPIDATVKRLESSSPEFPTVTIPVHNSQQRKANSGLIANRNTRSHLLLQSNSELARAYAPFLAEAEGFGFLEEDKSGNLKNEHYSIEAVLEAHNSSACYKNASMLLKFEAAQNSCLKWTEKSQCFNNVNCTWLPNRRICIIDSWVFLYNVSTIGNLPLGLRKVISINSQTWSTVFESQFHSSNKTINWNLVLKWEGPDFICPTHIPRIVCLFAKPLVATFSKSLYCTGKYTDSFALHLCNNDEYCETSIDPDLAICGLKYSLLEAAQTKAQKIFIENLNDPFLEDLYKTSTICKKATSLYFCSHEDCVRNNDHNICVPSPEWMMSRLVDKQSIDPICRVFSIAKESGCFSITNQHRCGHICQWDRKIRICRPSPDAFLKQIVKDDYLLNKLINGERSKCSELSQSNCQAKHQVVRE